MHAERDTSDVSGQRAWGPFDPRALLARAVDARRGRVGTVIAVATVALVAVAVQGGRPATLYGLAALLGAIGGVLVLPDGMVRMPTIRARLRAAGLVLVGGLGWAVLAVVVASGLRLAIGDDGGVGVGVALVTLGSYVLGIAAALGLTSSRARHGEQ